MPTPSKECKRKNQPCLVASEIIRRLGSDWCFAIQCYISTCAETKHRGMRKNAWLRAEKKRREFTKYLKSNELNDVWLQSIYKWK